MVRGNTGSGKLGRTLAVVTVTSQVNWNTTFSGSGHPKTISAIKMKFGRTDYTGEGNIQPTFRNDEITGGLSSVCNSHTCDDSSDCVFSP